MTMRDPIMPSHVEQAEGQIESVHDWQERVGETEETMLAAVHLANAHAILALVEQQKIANRIALTALFPPSRTRTVASGDATLVFEPYQDAGANLWRLRSDVIEAIS